MSETYISDSHVSDAPVSDLNVSDASVSQESVSHVPALKFHWYVVHVTAGSENKVATELNLQAAKAGLSDMIAHVRVPKRQSVVVKKGVRTQVEDHLLPGYVLVNMVCSPETVHVIRRIPRVIGLLGADSGGMPKILSEREVEKFLDQLEQISSFSSSVFSFEPGEIVKVSDGLFASMEGVVEEVDVGRSRLKVSISILGRSTPVELDFAQVEKLG